MDCKQIEADGVIEQYVSNRLPNAARKAFEMHYFGCEPCFERLEAYRAAGTALRTKARAPRSRWIWIASIAAAIVIAMVVVRSTRHPAPAPTALSSSAPAAPDLTLLAQIEPPAYEPPTLRSVPDDATRAFQSAMSPYRRGDYTATIEALRRFLDGRQIAGRPFIDAEFFLGACYLITDRLADASAVLSQVAAVDSPYREEAHFLLAQAWLKQRDASRAKAELEQVAAMHGDLQARAEQLIDKLR